MSTAFAQAQAIAGAAIVQLLANAKLTVGADTVDGHFVEHTMNAQLGGAGMQAQEDSFTCATLDLDALTVVEGTAVSIVDGASYTVAVRTDGVQAGQTQLLLKRA